MCNPKVKTNYSAKYERVIDFFKRHPPASSVQTELHHVIPVSLGGTNNPENTVCLPIRWHYIVHCWLPAVCLERGDQEGYEKMLFAWNRMQNYRRGHREALGTVKEDSLLYEKLRKEYLGIIGKHTSKSGNQNSMFGKHWWKDPNDKSKSMAIVDGNPIPAGWIRGRWISDETLSKMTKANRRSFRFINNGSKNRKIPEFDLIPEGWKEGKIKTIFSEETKIKLSLKAKDEAKRWKEKNVDRIKSELRPLFECLKTEGFWQMVKKFDYKHSQANFLKRCKQYFPEEYEELMSSRPYRRKGRPKQF